MGEHARRDQGALIATVTYRGPRPELFLSMPMPIADFLADLEGGIHVINYGPLRAHQHPTAHRYVMPHAYLLLRDQPTPVGALFALGLALIRRRPSPWFEVRLGRGEWAEVAHRIPRRIVDRFYECYHDQDEAHDATCPFYDEVDRSPYGPRVMSYLGWSKPHVADVLKSEGKVMYVNGELTWAPPGWAKVG